MPPTGETRAQILVDYAEANDLDLRESVAYADSTSDLPMLEAVGFPVAVNPETRLAALARKRGWLVEHWSQGAGAPRAAAADRARARESAATTPGPLAARESVDEGAASSAASVPRFAAAMVAGRVVPGGGARVGPLRLRDVDPPELPGPGLGAHPAPPGRHLRQRPGHHRRHARRATSSPSCRFPFVPGHEVVADASAPTAPTGWCSSRCWAAWPAASTRRARPAPAATWATASASPSATSSPACRSGFCCDTGGGWSTADGGPPQPAPRRARPT